MPWHRHIDPALLLALALTGFASLRAGAGGFSLLCLLLASGGMALFCRRRSGRLGALIAGLVYACSPALLATVGDSRALLALALFPIALWRLDALRDRLVRLNFLLAVLAQTVFMAAHPSAIWLGAYSALWIAVETAIQYLNRESSRMRANAGLLALLALLLGTLAALPLLHSPPPIGIWSRRLRARRRGRWRWRGRLAAWRSTCADSARATPTLCWARHSWRWRRWRCWRLGLTFLRLPFAWHTSPA